MNKQAPSRQAILSTAKKDKVGNAMVCWMLTPRRCVQKTALKGQHLGRSPNKLCPMAEKRMLVVPEVEQAL